MIFKNFIVAASTLASGGATVTGTPFDQAPSFAPQSIKLDDPFGKGFHWNKRLPCGANRATVTVKFNKSYPNETGEAPLAKVWLHSGEAGDSSEQWAAAVLKAPTDT